MYITQYISQLKMFARKLWMTQQTKLQHKKTTKCLVIYRHCTPVVTPGFAFPNKWAEKRVKNKSFKEMSKHKLKEKCCHIATFQNEFKTRG